MELNVFCLTKKALHNSLESQCSQGSKTNLCMLGRLNRAFVGQFLACNQNCEMKI